ncbi:MAG TPA: hypothetical protein DCL66_16545 [Gammaproteobacteria bacterium]|nr:hypothetical protein [Gammaproteobacteria bacterium]
MQYYHGHEDSRSLLHQLKNLRSENLRGGGVVPGSGLAVLVFEPPAGQLLVSAKRCITGHRFI